ncbi:hypothetical protein MaudMau93_001753 [Microsporum audouinii]
MLDKIERWTRWWLEHGEEGYLAFNFESFLAAQAYLARILLSRSKFAEAEETSRLALQQLENGCGRVPLDNKPHALTALCQLVLIYYDLEKYDKAKELYLKILPALDKWQEFDDFAELRGLIERCLQILERLKQLD